ncbi:MAG: AMP-binding protein [Nitrospirota bacterium]
MKLFYEIDRLPADAIKGIQDGLLSETITHAYERVPYYREAFKERSLLPSDIKGVEDLSKLPFTNRRDIQNDNWAFLSTGRQDIAEIVSTTGTTGDPVFIALTRNDLERLSYNEEKSFSYAGAGKGDFFHIAVTCDNLFIAGIAYYGGLIRLGASVVRIGPQNTIRHLNLIERLKPTGIVAVPSFMVHLGRRAKENNIKVKEMGIKKIVLIGDSIRNEDFSSNILGKLIEDSFGEICYSTYGITEAQVAFCECQFRQGLHSHPDLVLVEVVDDDGNTLPDGKIGELVLTPLQLAGMPLIRYKTGDTTFKISGTCPCGRNSVRIGPIIGRKHQRMKLKGVTLYPKTIENAILDINGVANYQIEANTGDDQTDHIVLRIGSHKKDNGFRASLIEILRAKARVTPDIEIESPGEIEKRLFEDGGRKATIFKDRRIRSYE